MDELAVCEFCDLFCDSAGFFNCFLSIFKWYSQSTKQCRQTVNQPKATHRQSTRLNKVSVISVSETITLCWFSTSSLPNATYSNQVARAPWRCEKTSRPKMTDVQTKNVQKRDQDNE